MAFNLQKANFWKRISAFMFDFVLTLVIALAIMIGMHAILKVDAKIEKLNNYRAEFAEKIDLDLDLSNEEYEKLPEAEKKAREEKFKELEKMLWEDKEVRSLNSEIITNVSVSVITSLLIGTTIWYFVIPLCFKHGRTLGKKIFGLAVVRTNGVKLTNPILFVRSLIGLYAIETMFPLTLLFMTLFGSLGIVGLITIGLFAILQIFVMIYTKTNSCIHDLLTDSVVVDMASQQIFETQEERTEFDKAEAARKAAEQEGDRVIATGIFAPKTQPAPPVQIARPTTPSAQPILAEPVVEPPAVQAEPTAQPAEPKQTERTETQAPAPQAEEATKTAETQENAENSAQ